MTALNIISLQEAKDFLVVDYPDRDVEISRHIKSAIGFIETYTNVIMYERQTVYLMTSNCREIYDAPIKFANPVIKTKQNILSVTVFGTQNDIIDAIIGYDDVSKVPGQLIEAAYKMLQYLFDNHDIYTAGLPWDIQMMCNPYRRSSTF